MVTIEIKLEGVTKDRDRHGNWRYYFRRKGEKKVRLRGEPGSKKFMDAYHAAQEAAPLPVAPGPGSFLALTQQFYNSAMFKSLEPRSQRVRRNILDRFCKKHGRGPYKLIEPRHVMRWRDELFEKPGAATNLLKALRHVLKFAVKAQLIALNPAEKNRVSSQGR